MIMVNVNLINKRIFYIWEVLGSCFLVHYIVIWSPISYFIDLNSQDLTVRYVLNVMA